MSSMQPGPAAAPGAGSRAQQSAADPLGGLDERPLAEHADVFQRLHAELQAALADIDS